MDGATRGRSRIEMGRSRTIGRLAEEAGVHVETVRYYERRGILEQPPKPDNGWRVYGDEALETLRFVKRAQWLGFSLDEIEELLVLRREAKSESVSRAVSHIRAKLSHIEQKLNELTHVRNTLHRLATQYEDSELFDAFHHDQRH
jgi:MerR family mercuric resistance operon transcriptional regulator